MEKKDIRHQAQAAGEQLALFADIYQESERQTEAAADPLRFADDHGIYRPNFTQSLHDRATAYHNNNRAAVEKLLKDAGITDQEAARILTDYHAAAYGLTLYTATPETMTKALNNLSPRKCYLTDKYLFYDMIFRGYADRLNELRRYLETLAAKDKDKIFYLYPLPPIPGADAVSWGIIYGFIDVATFSRLADSPEWEKHRRERAKSCLAFQEKEGLLTEYGKEHLEGIIKGVGIVTPGSAFDSFRNDFVYRTREAGDSVRYYKFYYFAEKALLSTPLELSTITRPDVLEHQIPGEMYREYGAELLRSFATWDEKEGNILGEVDERPQLSILSRPLANIGAGGLLGFQLKDTPRPGKSILQLLRHKKETGEVAPKDFAMCEKVINGVNLMYNAGAFTFDNNGKLFSTYTSYRELAKNCGYVPENMSGEDREQLAKAALFLHNIQFIKDNNNCPPILFVEREDIDKKSLQIILPTEYVTGKNRLFVTPRQVEALRLAGTGAQQRFYNMILTRGHKLEDDILAMIYNFDAELIEAQETGGPAAVKKKKNNWSRNKSKKRDQLAKWFEEARARGVILYYKRTTGKEGPAYVWETWTNKNILPDGKKRKGKK